MIARALVGRRLAACCTVSAAVASIYRYEGRIETAAEVLLTAKTRASLTDAVFAAVRELHSYDTPALVAQPVTCDAATAAWIKSETDA